MNKTVAKRSLSDRCKQMASVTERTVRRGTRESFNQFIDREKTLALRKSSID